MKNPAGTMRATAVFLVIMPLAGCGSDDPNGFESITAYEQAFPDAPYLYPNLGEGERIESLRPLSLRENGEPEAVELIISSSEVSGRELEVCLSAPDVEVIPGSLNPCIFPVVLVVDGIEIRADATRLENYGLAEAEQWTVERPLSAE